MSSDYITRLRGELLRAGATAPARRRRSRVWHGLRPVGFAAATAVAAVAAVVLVLALVDGGGDERLAPAGEAEAFSYRVEPATAADATARVLRERLAAARIEGQVTTAGDGLTITAPATARADIAALTQPGRFGIYDWEASVLGPDGRPAPDDATVTGGADAGHAAALIEGQAAARSTGRPVRASAGWFVLGGTPALANQQIESAAAVADPQTGEPIVTLELTPQGQAAFTQLTRELARRGAERPFFPAAPEAAWQHFAIVVDDRLLSVPYVNFGLAPDGIDGAAGAHIAGDFTPESARRLALILNSGPLPGTLR